jgi:hypothetical protein
MNIQRATQWGSWLASYLAAREKTNPFLLAAKFGWRVVIENEDEASALRPAPMAEWDGRCRTIRLFIATLRRHFGVSALVLRRACAHELFHGLAATNYRLLHLPAAIIPKLNAREEEIAALAFSEALFNLHQEDK